MRDYLRVAFNRKPIGVSRKHPVNQLVHNLISYPARVRLDRNCYSFPVELWLKNAANRLLTPPKAKVDAHQLEAEVVSC